MNHNRKSNGEARLASASSRSKDKTQPTKTPAELNELRDKLREAGERRFAENASRRTQ